MPEKYLQYPMKMDYQSFTVCIEQTGKRFDTELIDKEYNVLKTAKHETIHQAILWSQNELRYLQKLNPN